MEDNLAKRLAVEFRVDEFRACKAIAHLERSIHYNIKNLHPVLLSTYNELSKC